MKERAAYRTVAWHCSEMAVQHICIGPNTNGKLSGKASNLLFIHTCTMYTYIQYRGKSNHKYARVCNTLTNQQFHLH